MAANDYILAQIGYEDLLNTQGTADVPTSGGGTREINGLATYYCHKDFAHVHAEDFTVDSSYTFLAKDTVTLGSDGSAAVTIAGGTSATLTIGKIGAAGTTTIHHDVTCNGDLTMGVGSTLAAQDLSGTTLATSGAATLNSATITTTLGVTGAATLSSTLGVADTISATKGSGTGLAVTANATVGGTLAVTGLSTLASASVTTTLGVTGAATLSSTLGVADTISATKGSGTGLAVTSNATIGGTLTVTGAATFNGGVLGSTGTFTDTVECNKSSGDGLTVASDMDVTGTAKVGTLQLASGYTLTYSGGAIVANNDVSITGDLTVSGAINYGNALYQSQQVSDYFQINNTAEFRLAPLTLVTIPNGTAWDITDKTMIYVNDSTGGTVAIGSVTGTQNQVIWVCNIGSTGLQIPLGNMFTGSAYTIASKKSAILQWDEANDEFKLLAEFA